MSDEVKPLYIDFIVDEISKSIKIAEDSMITNMLKKSDVFDDIGRNTFDKIAKDEKKMLCTSKGINVTSSALEDGTYPKCEIAAVITFDDLTNDPAPDFKLPELTDQALECKNDKCRCKVRLKENEGLKHE